MDIHVLGLTLIIHIGCSLQNGLVIEQELDWTTADAKCRTSGSIMFPGRRYRENDLHRQLSYGQTVWLNGYRIVADLARDGMDRVKTLRVDFTRTGSANYSLCETQGKFYKVSSKQGKSSESDMCQSTGAHLATIKSMEDLHNAFNILEVDKQYRVKSSSLKDRLFKQCQLGKRDQNSNSILVTYEDCKEAHNFICLTGETLLPLITMKMARKEEVEHFNEITNLSAPKPGFTLAVKNLESSTFRLRHIISSTDAFLTVWSSEFAWTAPISETSSVGALLSSNFVLASSETETSSSTAVSFSMFVITSSDTLVSSEDDTQGSHGSLAGEMRPENRITTYQALSAPSISDHIQIIVQTSDRAGIHTESSFQHINELTFKKEESLGPTSPSFNTSVELHELGVTTASLELVQGTMSFVTAEPIGRETSIISEFTDDRDIHDSKLLIHSSPVEAETYLGTGDIAKYALLWPHYIYPSPTITVSLADSSVPSQTISTVTGVHSNSQDNSQNIGIDYEYGDLVKIYRADKAKIDDETSLSSVSSTDSSLVASTNTTDDNYDTDMDDDDKKFKYVTNLILPSSVLHQTKSRLIIYMTDDRLHATDDIVQTDNATTHKTAEMRHVTDTKSETDLSKLRVTLSTKYVYDTVYDTTVKYKYFTEIKEMEAHIKTSAISDLDNKSVNNSSNKGNDADMVLSTQYPKDQMKEENIERNVGENSLQGKNQNTSDVVETVLWIAFAVIVLAIIVSIVIVLVLHRRRNQQKSQDIDEPATSTSGSAVKLRNKVNAFRLPAENAHIRETVTFKDSAYEI